MCLPGGVPDEKQNYIVSLFQAFLKVIEDFLLLPNWPEIPEVREMSFDFLVNSDV